MTLLRVSTLLRRLLPGALLALLALSAAHAQNLDYGFDPDVNAQVYAVAILPGGQIGLGGGFTTVGGTARQYLARLGPGGALDASMARSPNAPVRALAAQADGKLLVGGSYGQVNSNVRYGLSRIDASGALDAGFAPIVMNSSGTAYVLALVVQPDGKILAGGVFTTLQGAARGALGRLNASGALDATFKNPAISHATGTPQVLALAVLPSGKVMVGGNFTHVGGQPRANLARLNADGTLDASFAPQDANGVVRALAVQADGAVVAGGEFTTLGGQPRSRIARLNADGSLDAGFAASASTSVYTLAVQADGKVVLGGQSVLARLNADGTPDAAFSATTTGIVQSLAVDAGGQIVLGGTFTSVNGQPRNRVARLHPDGALDATQPASADNTVLALAAQADGKLLMGGNFTGRLARLNADGSADAAYTRTADGTVYAIAAQPGGHALVAGNFNDPGPSIARLHADGTVDAAFAAQVGTGPDGSVYALALLPGASNAVQALAVQADGKLLVGGYFDHVGAQARNHIARLHDDGSVDAGFDPAPNGFHVASLAVQADGKVLVGGFFTQIGAQPRNYLARLMPDGTPDSFNVNTDGPVWSILLQGDGKIAVGGEFYTINGNPARGIAMLDGAGTFLPTGLGANQVVYALALLPGGNLAAGGAFTQFNGQPRNGIARVSMPAAPLQTLRATATRDGLRWLRSGAAPELAHARFAYATTENAPDAAWTDLGAATRITGTPGGWALDGLALPQGQRLWVRAQGPAQGGYGNGSASLAQHTAMLYLAAAPDVPAAPTATAGDEQVTLAWAAPADGGSPITSYTVTGAPGGTCTPVPATATTCTVTGLANGTAYTFTVAASNAMGDGAASPPSASATPQGAQTITFNDPGAQSFGTTLTLGATASSGLPVAYAASGDCTVSLGVASYTGAGNCTITATQPGDAATLPAAPVAHAFAVLAAAPGAPTSAMATPLGPTAMRITWMAPASSGGSPITGYTVTASPGGLGCTTTGALTCDVAGLAPGTAYSFTVVASNGAQASAPSAATSASTPAAPVPPAGAQAIPALSQRAVPWLAVLLAGVAGIKRKKAL